MAARPAGLFENHPALNEEAEAGFHHRYNRGAPWKPMDEALQAVQEKTIDGLVVAPAEVETVLGNYPALEIGGSLREEESRGFVMGTNQIGQDILSRIIWGTRIALIVGLSSAIVSVVVGVP
jgi:peptide/nickel transport system permease protein